MGERFELRNGFEWAVLGQMTQPVFQTLAQAVEVYYDELRRFVLRRTGSPTIAEDIVQETWIRANATSIAMPVNPRAYLYRMASNLTIDHIRRNKRHKSLEVSGTGPSSVSSSSGQERTNFGDQIEQIACPAPAPDEVTASRQELSILSATVLELPEKCREVFLLYRGQGLTMREVAQRLNISEKTVEKHIARAMLQCRKALRSAGRDV